MNGGNDDQFTSRLKWYGNFQQWTWPSKKYTIPKTTRKPRQPPPHFQPAYPAINVLSQLFIFIFLSIKEKLCQRFFIALVGRKEMLFDLVSTFRKIIPAVRLFVTGLLCFCSLLREWKLPLTIKPYEQICPTTYPLDAPLIMRRPTWQATIFSRPAGQFICRRTYRDNLYITVDLQGDTRQPPRLEFVVSGKWSISAGLALVDPKRFNRTFQR